MTEFKRTERDKKTIGQFIEIKGPLNNCVETNQTLERQRIQSSFFGDQHILFPWYLTLMVKWNALILIAVCQGYLYVI
jgi:hypothetical protein